MVNGYDNYLEDNYRVPIIAKILHSLPHLNITFHRTNNTFRPTDEIYLESLGILGSLPAAALIVSLFCLLLYLMSRCCDRKPRPAHSITSLKVTLSIVTLLCCGAIGLGLYGNDDLHNGFSEVLTAGRKVDNLVSSVRNQTNALEHTLTQKIRPQLSELADIFDDPVSNQTALSILINALDMVQKNITVATNAAGDIRRPMMGISMNHILNKGETYELYRWPGTVAILGLLLVLCALLLVGVARHARCALIIFSVCGLVAVTGSWLMSGIYLSASVAIGDLCADPAEFLVSQAPPGLPPDVLLYYTQCETSRSNPFTQRLRESQQAINSARAAMNTVIKVSPELFKKMPAPKLSSVVSDLNTSERLLTGLTALVDCKLIHYNYLVATRGLCDGGLLGLVLMLVASFLAACLLTIMIFIDSHTWIYIRKRNDYASVEEQQYAIAQQQQQQLLQQQYQHHQQSLAHRTLPRHQNGPPITSGSMTLGHPNKQAKHQEAMLAAANMQQGPPIHPQQMRQQQQQQQQMGMGTQTLGRHHSPNHMRNNSVPHQQNIYQAQQLQQHPSYKQFNPNIAYTESLPPPPLITQVSHGPPQNISGNPAYTQQQQIYIQQQQQLYAQQQQQYQTLRRKQVQIAGHGPPGHVATVQAPPQQQAIQYTTQQQAQQAQLQAAHQQQQQQQQQHQMNIPPQISQPMQIQAQQPQHYVVTSSGAYTTAPPSATMAIVTANNAVYVQSATIPSSMENQLYEQNKQQQQIYKCSTLGRHAKNPNLVPAVIPTVPQIPKYNGHHQQQQQTAVSSNSQTLRPSIQSCPLPDIPNSQISTFKTNNDMMTSDLPQNRFYTQKRPTGKPVGLPKIGSFESNHPPCLNNINNNNQKTQQQQLQHQQHSQNNQDHHLTMNSDTNSNIEVPSTKQQHDPTANNQTNNHQQNQNLPLPPPPVDDNYAVTEL